MSGIAGIGPIAESTYLIDTYGAVATATGLGPPGPVVAATHPPPLVSPVKAVTGLLGTQLDAYA